MKIKCNLWMSSGDRLEPYVSGMSVPHIVEESLNMASWGDVKIGTAIVEMTFDDQDNIVLNQIRAEEKRLANLRAENQVQENAILDRISKLKALTFEAA